MGGKNQEKEASIKYFIAQSIPSAILIIGFILFCFLEIELRIFIFIALLIKIGVAPMHYWLPSVIGSVRWVVCWLLSSVQKLVPIIIIVYFLSFSHVFIFLRASFSSLVGGLGGLNQTLIRVILAYSSIGHIGWILGVRLSSSLLSILYFISYIIAIRVLFILLDYIKVRSGNFVKRIKDRKFRLVVVMVIFLRLGGLPPFFGFYPKILVLERLFRDEILILCLILILGSIINLYYYLKVFFIIIFSWFDRMISIFRFNLKVRYIILRIIFIFRLFSIIIILRVL